VIAVPPVVDPELGLTVEIVGGVTYVNAFVSVAVPPAVITATFFVPAVPAGVTAVTVVGDCTTILVATTPPTVTLDAPERFVPVIVIAVPPVVGPALGLIEPIVGGVTNVNPFVSVAVPPAAVTLTVALPAVPPGVFAVIVVALTTTTLVAPMPPTVTLAPARKFVPVMTIAVPPVVGPALGLTDEIVGTGVT